MRFLMLLLVPSLAFAMDVATAITAHDKAVAIEDAKLVKVLVTAVKSAKDVDKPDLYKLILKYDPNNEPAQAFVNAAGVGDKADLLGATIQTISQLNAVMLAKAYASDKIKGKDWEGFPGKEVKISTGAAPVVLDKAKKGRVYLIAPNPDDKWQLSIGGIAQNYKGDQNGQLLVTMIDSNNQITKYELSKSVLVTVANDGDISLVVTNGGMQMIGSVRVKVLEVLP